MRDSDLQTNGLAPFAPQASPSSGDAALAGLTEQILLCRLDAQVWALPLSAVERVLRMTAIAPLPGAPVSVVGLLNLAGETLPVVDPRCLLDHMTPAVLPDQNLVVIAAGSRYVLWVDKVETIATVEAGHFDAVTLDGSRPLAPRLVRHAGASIPVLCPGAFDPGPIVQQQARGAR